MDFINAFLVSSAVQAITPILLAALAGALCGRVGVFNIALEGQLLVGAFAAVVGSYYTQSAWGGVICAMVATMGFSLILGFGVTLFRGDAVVISVGMNLLAAGLTAYLLREMFGVSGTFSDPAIVGLERIRIPELQSIPVLGWIVSRQTLITWFSWLMVIAMTVMLFRTPLGLRMRGVGEDPAAAESMGIKVDLYRFVTVVLTGALVGLGGAQLSLGTVSIFSEGMSAGRGWIAIVAVMLGREHPAFVALACVLFGFADAFSIRLQSEGLPNQLTDAVPYVVTLIALVLSHRRRAATAA